MARAEARAGLESGNGRTWDRTRDLPRVKMARLMTTTSVCEESGGFRLTALT
jgi:hypothetical protein